MPRDYAASLLYTTTTSPQHPAAEPGPLPRREAPTNARTEEFPEPRIRERKISERISPSSCIPRADSLPSTSDARPSEVTYLTDCSISASNIFYLFARQASGYLYGRYRELASDAPFAPRVAGSRGSGEISHESISHTSMSEASRGGAVRRVRADDVDDAPTLSGYSSRILIIDNLWRPGIRKARLIARAAQIKSNNIYDYVTVPTRTGWSEGGRTSPGQVIGQVIRLAG
jgi:hypothetical protein